MVVDEQNPDSGDPAARSLPARVRVLLADDNADFRRQAARFLSMEPRIEVVAFAASGAEAIEKVERFAPDLVLMDLSMPGLNGLDAARRIKARADAPLVVIVTMYGGALYRGAAEAALVNGFLSKTDFVREFTPLLEKLIPAGEEGR